MEPYSVLMSVYIREDPQFLESAMASILEQTVLTDDFVIVCDGPLTPAHDAVFEKYKAAYPGVIHDIRLAENVGIGAAANLGLQACKHELIAKMDSDDISVRGRCEAQLSRFAQKPELTILGGDIEEFDSDLNFPHAIRSVPRTNEEIRICARRRQPFNNVTVMLKKSAVLSVGGYRTLRRNEDYDLYIRLLNKGYYAENLDIVLVKARVDKYAYQRRSSILTLKATVRSRWNAYQIGYSSLGDFLYCSSGALLLMICPSKVREWIYMTFLRKKIPKCPDTAEDNHRI